MAEEKTSSKWEMWMCTSVQTASENTWRDLANDRWHFWPIFTALCDVEVKKKKKKTAASTEANTVSGIFPVFKLK